MAEINNDESFSENYGEQFGEIEDELEKDLFRIFNYIQNGKAKEGENSFSNIKFKYTYFPGDRILFKGIEYCLPKESRIINFYKKKADKSLEKLESHFIISIDYFKSILNKLNAMNFVAISENINLNDSNTSIDDPNSTFYNEKVKNILIYNNSNILIQENLNKKIIKNFGFDEIKIKDLSLNAKIYFPDTYQNIYVKSRNYIKYIRELSKYVETNLYRKISYLLGNKGCSKSTILLTFIQVLHKRKKNWGSMYFNIEALEKLTLIEIKVLLLKEALYLVSNADELNNLKLINLFKEISTDILTPIFTVQYFIHEIIDNYEKIFYNKEGIVFIIDNFNVNNKENEVICLKKIIEYIGIQRKNIKLIISGNGNFFNEKIRKYFFRSNKNYETLIYMNDKNFDFPNINIEEIQNVPLYYFNFKNQINNYSEFRNEIITKEKNYLKEYSFDKLYYSLYLNNLIIPLKELEYFDIFDYLPDYFKLYQEENSNNIKFEISNVIFYESIVQSIEYLVEKKLYKKINIKKKLPESPFAEEYLISLLLKYNNFNVINLNYFETIQKVRYIYDFKSTSTIPLNEFLITGNFIITQDSNNQNCDLLMIIKIENIDYAIFVQIGVDKDYSYINNLKMDLNYNYEKYIYNLNFTYKRKISYISLLFIFDEKIQMSKIHIIDKNSCGSKICELLNIDYLWISLENKQLYSIKFEQNEFKNKTVLLEYIPNKFLLGKKVNLLDNNKICFDGIINPIYPLKENQIKTIEGLVEKIFGFNYKFSILSGKNFQYSLPKNLISNILLKYEEEFPYVHIFSSFNDINIFVLIKDKYYRIGGKLNDSQNIEFSQIYFENVIWDIYRLKINLNDKIYK